VDFYNCLKDEADVWKALEQKDIQILDGFQNNIELVRQYYHRMYASRKERIVFCGINPGKNGAGKTGIPFIDFKGASQLLPGVNENSSENSAQFILSVIDEIGVQEYHNLVYMTNISWYGFSKDKKNLNYYDLPSSVQKTFTASFIAEMDIVQPKMIVPLSERVEKTLREMVADGKLNYPIAKRLPHPYYCSIGKNKIPSKKMYIDLINQHYADQQLIEASQA